MYRKFFKRAIDSSLAAIGLVVCGIPMLIIAVCIKVDSKGPVFFRQVRLGKGMKPFTIFKFRTMCDHAYEMGGIATSSKDPRITKVGAFLRRTSLDELPQMFNILRGEMALIGPRPILDWEFEPYKDKENFKRRYEISPGLFCIEDIKYRASCSREIQFKLDVEYVDSISLKQDIKTFFCVLGTVISGKNVYREEVDGKHK